MRSLLLVLMLAGIAFPAAADEKKVPALDAHWDAGAEDCKAGSHPPLEVYRYDPRTYILREDLCSTWEAPFIYLLIGDRQALLIDTGDVADPRLMPLKDTVLALLPLVEGKRLPLTVVHSHTHLDHRAGDPQFDHLPGVTLVDAHLDSVRKFFGFGEWPQGTAELDLGARTVDVLPAPGHNPTHLIFYDRETGLLFSGDFLMAARLLVDDIDAYRASARRVADFVRDRPVSYVLGGHIEEDRGGNLYDWQSTHHPDEHALQLGKAEIMALPAALEGFNGFQSSRDGFFIVNSIHMLEAMGAAAILVLAGIGYLLYRLWRRRRRVV
ncbi:MAG TPA: MBL fold metallo-hydrolase [Gammaproteobacteria bacterium]|jgi:glyoxylase-like metal-dependent hydrolase (beta-lactamase superfamily II)|nr:MBL fold metallo-hydrolase [Gammaproteobacteria bacterium]